MRNVELIIRDPAHLEAHRAEFLIPLEEVLSAVNEVLNTRPASPGKEDIFVVRTSRPVGRGGLARVFPWTANDYWAPRAGRSIPSHLIYARRRPVRTLCVWGTWNTDSVFALHTVYAGKPAPREIHDPLVSGEELKQAVRFWTRHAIIVEK